MLAVVGSDVLLILIMELAVGLFLHSLPHEAIPSMLGTRDVSVDLPDLPRELSLNWKPELYFGDTVCGLNSCYFVASFNWNVFLWVFLDAV